MAEKESAWVYESEKLQRKKSLEEDAI